MNKLLFSGLIIVYSVFLLNAQSVHAQMGTMMGLDNEESQATGTEEHTESVEVILQDILDSQNVTTVQKLDLSKVTDDQWEELGDAVMEQQHPGEAHEAMDQMMGGEGSESLKLMHINMGKAYLGYGDTNYGPGAMMGVGMMGNRSFNTNIWQRSSMMGSAGSPFMGAGGFGFGPMMGDGAYGSYGVFGVITWILIVAFLASGTYFFLKGSRRK